MAAAIGPNESESGEGGARRTDDATTQDKRIQRFVYISTTGEYSMVLLRVKSWLLIKNLPVGVYVQLGWPIIPTWWGRRWGHTWPSYVCTTTRHAETRRDLEALQVPVQYVSATKPAARRHK